MSLLLFIISLVIIFSIHIEQLFLFAIIFSKINLKEFVIILALFNLFLCCPLTLVLISNIIKLIVFMFQFRLFYLSSSSQNLSFKQYILSSLKYIYIVFYGCLYFWIREAKSLLVLIQIILVYKMQKINQINNPILFSIILNPRNFLIDLFYLLYLYIF